MLQSNGSTHVVDVQPPAALSEIETQPEQRARRVNWLLVAVVGITVMALAIATVLFQTRRQLSTTKAALVSSQKTLETTKQQLLLSQTRASSAEGSLSSANGLLDKANTCIHGLVSAVSALNQGLFFGRSQAIGSLETVMPDCKAVLSGNGTTAL
jgi:cell division protein FtsL